LGGSLAEYPSSGTVPQGKLGDLGAPNEINWQRLPVTVSAVGVGAQRGAPAKRLTARRIDVGLAPGEVAGMRG
jgi:hypothetical protein